LEKLVGLSGRGPATASSSSTEKDRWPDDEDDYEDELSAERFTDEVSRPGISFADVGGMEEVKEEIRMKIIYPLQNRDLFRAYGKKLGGGVLLYGPPGCGKTLISQATAGEIRSNFISVALHQILDLYIGNSEKNPARA
jgi:SpoVK/Ycf46/Vps4 family AAA+-type ATPase